MRVIGELAKHFNEAEALEDENHLENALHRALNPWRSILENEDPEPGLDVLL